VERDLTATRHYYTPYLKALFCSPDNSQRKRLRTATGSKTLFLLLGIVAFGTSAQLNHDMKADVLSPIPA